MYNSAVDANRCCQTSACKGGTAVVSLCEIGLDMSLGTGGLRKQGTMDEQLIGGSTLASLQSRRPGNCSAPRSQPPMELAWQK